MWNRVLGLSNEKRETSSSSSGRRKDDDEKRPERKRTTSIRKSSGTEEKDRGIDPTSMSYSSSSRAPYSGAASASIASSYATAQSNNTNETILPQQMVGTATLASEMPKSQSGREEQSRDDDREQEKARKQDRSTGRNQKEDRQNRSRSRDREARRRDRKERRERRQERDGPKDSGLKKSESDHQKTNRAEEAVSGSGNFSTQVGGPGFTQFPGQFDGGVPGFPSGPAHPPHMSDHVPDQFPGQFPTGSSAPYRPPLSIEEGGPGLAADYYGDAGESVATQPGVRPQAPTLIVGAQPHLMAASPVEAPPAEPSSTGGVGAAASFFSGATFESPSGTPKPDQPPGRRTGFPTGAPPQPPYSSQPSTFALPSALTGAAALGYIASTHEEIPHGPAQGSASSFPPQNSSRPPLNTYPTTSMPSNINNQSSSTAPIIPTLGSAALGAAAGYMMGSHTSPPQPMNPPLPIQDPANYRPSNTQHPSQQMGAPQDSYPAYDRPPQSGKQSPSSSNLPLYAAGALGAAGLAAAAYHHEHHEHHDSAQNSYTGQSRPSAFMPQQHRHRGPLSKLVDFFRDPEGVAQFEEYSEYIGVCRYCFAEGSSPREAPRKHYYRRKRSNERLGASMRVDKESRYSSSDGESRRRNKNTSWIASGIAGMGLAKVGENLFASNHDFDDTYSVRSGRPNQSTASINDPRYNSSPNQRSGISHGVVTEPSNMHSTYDQKRHSTYKDHETGIGEAALVAAMGAASIADSSSGKRSRSPRGTLVGSKPRNTERDYDNGSERSRKDCTGHPSRSAYIEVSTRKDYKEKGRGSNKKNKKTGFSNFADSSSSDSGLIAHTGSDRSKAKKSSRTKIKDHNDANAALIGLEAAAVALAAAEGRKSDKGKRKSDIIAVKEVKVKDGGRSDERRTSSQKPIYSNMDEAQWESASEEVGYSSVDSALAYGVLRRRSNDSLHSESSGTDKWGWRWGSGSSKRKDKPKHESRLTDTIVGTAASLASAAVETSVFANEDPRDTARSSNSSLPPLQHVYPIATSDPSHYDVMRHDSVTSGSQTMRTSRPAAIPLQQPQPVMPVSSAIYAAQVPYDHSYSAPAGPPVFSQPPQPPSFVPGYEGYNRYVNARQGAGSIQLPPEQAIVAAVPEAVASERKPQRRETSPTPEIIYIEPKQPKGSLTRDEMSAVRFDLTEEQRNKEFRVRQRELERERKKSDFVSRDGELQYVNEDVNIDGKPRRSRKSSRSDENSRRDEEINSEPNNSRKPEDTPEKQKNGSAWVTPALVGVAGVVIGAAATERVSGQDDRHDARWNAKSDEDEDPIVVENDKNILPSDVEDEGQISHDDRQKALAKKAAALVKRTPSPAHQDYSSFFAPTDFLSKSNKKTIVDDSNGGNDITSYPVPQIVTNEPSDQRGPPSSVPYTFPGADEEGVIDPNFMRLPWQVPRLNLIKPTPPASMAGSVRGDASPVLQPEDAHASDNEEYKQSRIDSKRVKVTFGESETHEYEVVSPEDHRDEFIGDLSENRTTEQEQPIDQPIPVTSSQSIDSPVAEITRDHKPGDFGDDLDFAATLAAGLQGSGFDPAIVIDDPTYRRRDSPPGSENWEFYQKPFFETVGVLNIDPPGIEGALPQRGFVEGEILPTPKAKLLTDLTRPAEDGKENSNVLLTEAKTVEESNDNVKILPVEDGFRGLYCDSEVPHIIEVVPRTVLDNYGKSLVDQRPHVNEMSPDFTNEKDEFQEASEFASINHGSREMPAIQPEAGEVLEADADFISTTKRNKKPKGRGKNRDQDIYDPLDDDLISDAATASLPEAFGDQKGLRIEPKHKTSEYNNVVSVVPALVGIESEKDVSDGLRNGSVALASSVMDLKNQSADQDIERKPGKAREATLDDFEDLKKKSSKYKADEEWFEVEPPQSTSESSKVEEEEGDQNQISRSKRDKRKKKGRRNGNGDSGMVTQGIPAEDGYLDKEKDTVSLQQFDDHDPNRGVPRSNALNQPLSFLGMRREVTEPPDITSTRDPGSTVRRISSEETFRDAISSKIIEQGLPPLPASRPTSPTAVGSTGDLPSLPPSRTTSPVATPGGQRRRLSMQQLAESNHGGSSPSPTAVPFMFRKFPSSTGVSRSNPSSPGQSPRTTAPFSPRQRQGRPLSTEFKASTEFRPLWLVERHNPSRRSQGPEVAEEIYPSLPSSHSTSRSSSVHDPDIEDSNETHENDAYEKDIIVPQEVSLSFAHNSDHTDDFLDSQQPTPTRNSFNGLEARSIDPMHHLPSQSVLSAAREDGPDTELLEHEEQSAEKLPLLPRSRESSPYEETVNRDNSSKASGVAIGAMATGAFATILDSTSRSERDYDPSQIRAEKRESDDRFHVPELEKSRSVSGSIIPSDDLEALVTTKNKKNIEQEQQTLETMKVGDRGVPDEILLFGTAKLDRALQGAQVEDNTILEATPAQDETGATRFSSTSSKKSKKDKKDKGKSKSRNFDTSDVDNLQPERTAEGYVQGQWHEIAPNDTELQPKLDTELPISGRTARGSVAVTADVAAGAVLDAESSNVSALSSPLLENNDWPESSTKLKKGKKKKGKMTSELFEERLPASPSNIQEVEDLDSVNRVPGKVKDEDSFDVPSSKRSKKAKKNRKPGLTREIEENATSETDQSMAAVVPKNIEVPVSLSEIRAPGTIDVELGTVEPIQIETVSPEATALPADDDLDLLPALPPDSPLSEPQILENVNQEMLLEPGTVDGKFNAAKPRQVETLSPEAIALPADDDLDLLYALPPDSPLLEAQMLESVNQEMLLEPGTVDGKFNAAKPRQVETLSPEAIALPADDDLDLLYALPPDTPLTKPQSAFDFVTGERDLLNNPTSIEDAYPRTTLSYNPAMIGETHLPGDITERPTRDVEILPKGERRSFVESFEPQQVSAKNSHQEFSHANADVETDEPPMTRDLARESSGNEQQVDHGLNHSSKDFIEQRELEGSRSRTPQLEVTNNYSFGQKRSTIDVDTPTANTIANPFVTTVGEVPAPYEEPPTSNDHAPANDIETADGYSGNVQDEDESVLFPTLKNGKKGKKGRKSQPVTPLEEPVLAQGSIVDPSDEASASVPEIFAGIDFEEASSVVNEPATDEWAITSKKKGKKGRKSQPVTLFKGSSSADRSIAEMPNEASASLEDKGFGNVTQKACAVTDEPITDEWATSSKRKGKKGKKSQPITPLEEPSLAERSIVATSFDNPIMAQEAILDVIPKDRAFGDELLVDEWATTSKQRGKKSKKRNIPYEEVDPGRDDRKEVKDIADLRDLGDADQRSLETLRELPTKQTDLADQERLTEHDKDYLTAAVEFSLATTNTAKEVGNMLASAKKDSAIPDGQFDSRDVYRYLSAPEAQVSPEAIEQETETSTAAPLANADLVEDGKRETEQPVATTDTAAEIRNMLISTDDVGLVTPAQEENQFSDHGFSGFTTKKKSKKGKKNTPPRFPDSMPLNDNPPTTVSNSEDASMERITRETEPIDAFSVLNSRKDKKNKRKAIFQSVSHYQDTSEPSDMVTEIAVDPKSISQTPGTGPDQNSSVDEATSTQLPSQETDELLEEGTPDKEPMLVPLEASVQRFDTASIDEASNIALPTDEMENLEEREQESVGIPHAREHDPNYKYPKSESRNFSQPPPIETSDIDPLIEAIRLPLPEDLQSDFVEGSKLLQETVSSVEEYPTSATKFSDAARTQPGTKDPMQRLDRGFAIASDIPNVQSPVALYTEEDVGAVGQDIYNKSSMISENFGEEERLDHVRSTVNHSRSELKELPVVHMDAPLSTAAIESGSLEDKTQVRSTSGPFAGQSGEIATTSPEAMHALPVFIEQNDPLVDDDDFLRFNDKDKGKTISSKSDGTVEPAPKLFRESLTEEPAQSFSPSRELQMNPVTETESIANINNEGFFASTKGKKDKKNPLEQSWEDEPAEKAVEEPLAEASTESDSIPKDFVDFSRPESEPMMTIEDDGFSVSKKSKKGKKNRNYPILDSTKGPSPLPEIDQEPGTTPAFDFVDIAVEEPSLPSRLTAEERASPTGEDSLSDLPKGKKGKKKSKKSQALDWADQPPNMAFPTEPDPSTSAVDPDEALPTSREVLPLSTTKEQIATTNDDNFFDLPKGKKSKKKSKKSQAFDWLDETADSPDLVDPRPSTPTLRTVEASSIDYGEPLAISAEEQSIIAGNEDVPFEPSKGKKGKKKSKKSQAVDWDNEPSSIAAPADSELENDLTSADTLQVPEMERTASQLPMEEPESESFSLKKSKRDKKKAKKGTSFAWDEEPAQDSLRIEDDTVTGGLPGTPLDRDIVQPKTEEAKPRESYEDKIDDVLDSSERETVSLTKVPRGNVDNSVLLLGDKNGDQEVYPAFGLEEGIVQEPDDIRVSRPAEEPDAILESGAVREPGDVLTLQNFDKRQDDLQQEVSHESGGIKESQRIGSDHGIDAFHKPVTSFETREVIDPGTVYEREAAPQQGVLSELGSALDLTLAKDLEPPVRSKSFDILPETLPKLGNNQEIEPERADLPDMVEPQEDELFLPFQTKKKKKKGKGSGQATPSYFETREEPAPLVDEEPPLTLEDIGLNCKREGAQPSQSLEKSLKEAAYEENDPSAAGTSLASEPERPTDMPEPGNIEIPIAEDEFSGFTMKKKNKKAKRFQQAADSRFEEPLTQPGNRLAEGAFEPVPEERDQNLVESSSYAPARTADSSELSTQDAPIAEDDFGGFASKRKGKKGKKAKQSEVPVYEEPGMDRQTLEPLLPEGTGDGAQGIPVYRAERAEDIPSPNIRDDFIQDDNFVGFATKKKKGKKSKQNGNQIAQEPASEAAIMAPELFEDHRDIGEDPLGYEQKRNPDTLDSITQDEPAAEDDFDGFATKKGKKFERQYLDLEPTSSTTDLQEDQSISDRGHNMTKLAEEEISSREDSSVHNVPVAQIQNTREQKVEQEYRMSREREGNPERRGSTNAVKPLVAATAVGASIALFEDLARRDSMAASKKEKNRKKSDQYSDWVNEKQGEPAFEQSSGLPNTAEYHEPLENSSFSGGQTRALSPQYDQIRNRDSAIQVAESPIPGAQSPLHYSIRDSGYQGNDASPTLQEILALPRQNRFSNESVSQEIEHDISPVHDYETNTIDQSHRTATQLLENSHNPLNISIEVDPAYDVSISRPVQVREVRREASQGRGRELEMELPASYSEHHEQYELSNTASRAKHYDDRQPSPVDSTTRDRSSVLFQSSPSTREDNIHHRPLNQFAENTTEHTTHPEMPQHLEELPTSIGMPYRPDASVTREIESTKAPQSSLFGGPIGANSDLHTIISPPGTPNSSRQRQLDSMSESGLEDSPLQEKSQRILDGGLQEASLRGTQRSVAPQRQSQQRVRSPLGDYTEDKEPYSTNDIISRLSWPRVDEENRSVDPDRSKSRNTDTAQRSSSRHSPLPALAIDMAKQREPDFRSISGASIRSGESISAYIRSPDVQSPATPPLRRADRSISGDLRAANKRGGANQLAKQAESELESEPGFASSSSYDPARDKGKEPITKMTDVYEGWGDVHGSPRSPTRPPSMRKRQSMQLLDLETRIDQLISENRLLQDAKARADRQLGDAVEDHSLQKSAFDDAIRTRDLYVQQKNSELNELRGILDGLQSEVSRLKEINEGLSGSTRELTSDHEQRYGQLEDDHADVHQKWQESSRELEDLRQQHASLSAGMEGIVRHEVDLALESKDIELRQMRNELEAAKDQVRRLQQQILASRSSDDIIVARDEDYFDSQCQQLCQHVQQWVLRFSKFSDMKPCLSIDEVADERISDRFDNAILDGSDVDIYLADRIKRRDVFMSVVMTMVWEYIFQRYLFGLDREQRQKLKSLEKTLSEAGPARAVNKWRATTLTMLARRASFLAQRQQDTEAVVREIFDALAVLLPPPGHLVGQITDSLRKVMTAAVNLAIEMRCQLCEYIMPPPLQPEYDTHGDLARQVFFNPALMNERSGATASNDELGAQRAVVRLVLFPLVLKKGDDDGEGDEEIVVCPAQVLVARDIEPRAAGKKIVRVVSAQSQRADAVSQAGQSVQSFAPSSMDAGTGGRF